MFFAKNKIEIGKIKKFFASGKWRLAIEKYFSVAESGKWQSKKKDRVRKMASGKIKSEIGNFKSEIGE